MNYINVVKTVYRVAKKVSNFQKSSLNNSKNHQ